MSSSLKLIAALIALVSLPAQAAEWRLESSSGALKIYKRDAAGSDIKELKAITTLNAPAYACKNVVDDVAHYTEFMPNTAVAKVLKHDGKVMITYQRIEAPIISDRDYTIRKVEKSYVKKDGTPVYRQEWNQANHLGPKEKSGVVRLKKVSGAWTFEAIGDKKTRATYYLHTDPGGALPSFVVNMANHRVIPKLFKAVETQANKPKYVQNKPAPPSPPAPAKPPPAVKETPPAADGPGTSDG